jgi:hypothetical protein
MRKNLEEMAVCIISLRFVVLYISHFHGLVQAIEKEAGFELRFQSGFLKSGLQSTVTEPPQHPPMSPSYPLRHYVPIESPHHQLRHNLLNIHQRATISPRPSHKLSYTNHQLSKNFSN